MVLQNVLLRSPCPTEQYSKNFWSEEGSPSNSLKTLPPPVFPLNFSDEKSGKKLRFSESWAKMEPKVSNRKSSSPGSQEEAAATYRLGTLGTARERSFCILTP